MKRKFNQFIAIILAMVMVVLGTFQESVFYASEKENDVNQTEAAEETEDVSDGSDIQIEDLSFDSKDNEDSKAITKEDESEEDKAKENISEKDMLFDEQNIPDYVDKDDVVLDGTSGYAYGYEDVLGNLALSDDDLVLPAADDSNVKEGYTNFAPFKDKHELYVDSTQIKDGSTIDPKKNFKLILDFELTRNNMAANGLDYYYVLPEHISVGNVGSESSPETLFMTSALSGEKIPIGTYFIEDNVIYVSFPGYYDYTYAMIEMSGSWEDYENRSYITVDWDGTEEKYNLDVCDLSIVKSSTGYVSNSDGSLSVTYKIKVTADSNGGNIKDITFADKFSPGKLVMDKDTFAGDAIRLTVYHEDKTIDTQSTYSYDDVVSGSYDINITGIDMEAGGYFIVEYKATVPTKERLKIDANNGQTGYTNKATASYEIINAETGDEDTLSVSTEIKNSYSSQSKWVYKEAGDSSTKKIDGVERTIIPYVVGINKHRYYSLGGSIVSDEITGFVGGRVNYLTTGGTTEVEVTDNNGNKTVQQTWIVLDDLDLYTSLQELASSSSKTALERLRENSSLQSKLVAAINSATGENYTEFNDEMALKYVFTYEDEQKGCYNFVWFMPMDENPTSYIIRYDTYIINDPDSEVTEFDNSVSMWYTDIEGVPYGPGAGWVKPVNKVLNSTKKNDGVYVGDDGNYYVDYKITVGLEPGSAAFDDVMLKDIIPSHSYTLPSGNRVYLKDWFAGLEATDFVPNVSAKQTFNNFNAIFNIYTESDDPNVQKVVDNSYASIHRTESNWYVGYWTKNGYGVSNMTESSVIQESTMYESPETFAAGQFINNTSTSCTYSSSRALDPGETYSPDSFYVYLGPLPATEEGYDIVIEYTMQVNPMLVDVLPELLEQEGNEYITQTNSYTVYTTYMKMGYDGKAFEALEAVSAGKISGGKVNYWLGIDDDYPGIAKEVGEYDGDENTLGYSLTINPSKDINGENKTYEITDNLNISGLKYIPNSFKIVDEDNNVVYSSKSSEIASKYKGLVAIDITDNDKDSNNFAIRLDNSDGVFTETDSGKIKQLTVTYDVDTSTIETDLDIYNVAEFVKIETDGETGEEKRVVLGNADVEYAIDKALDKKIVEEPSVANAYDATYRIDVKPSSENSDGMMDDDEFTVKDTLNTTLTILFETAKVYLVKDGSATNITNTCTLGYNEHTREFTATVPITDKDAIYRIEYKAHVEGEANRLVITKNEAEVIGKDIKTDKVEEKIVIYQYNTESVAYNMQVKLQKYNRYNIDEDEDLDAEFEIYRWVTSDDMSGDLGDKLSELGATAKSWVKLSTTGNGNIETGTDGLVIINNNLTTNDAIPLVEKDTFYMLKEVKAPGEYTVDPTPIYYFVSSTGDEPDLSAYGIRTYISQAGDYSLLKLAPIGTTDEDLPILYVGNEKLGFSIEKIDGEEKTILKGAGFTLYKDEACSEKIAVSKDADDGKEDGIIDFANIDVPVNATYYLKEITVPEGYADLSGTYTLVFEDGQITSVSSSLDTTYEISLVNGKSRFTAENTEKKGKLKVAKTVNYGNKQDEFTYAVIFKNSSGSEITSDINAKIVSANGDEEAFTYKSGDTFKLKSGEYALFKGLEEGTTYKVTEVPGEYYIAHVKVTDEKGDDAMAQKTGTKAEGSIEELNMDTVDYTNNRAYSVTVTKKALSEDGQELDIPDGLIINLSKYSGGNVARGVYNENTGEFDVTTTKSDYKVTQVENGFTISGIEVTYSSYSNRFIVTESKADKEEYTTYVCTYDIYSDGKLDGSDLVYTDNAEHNVYSNYDNKGHLQIDLKNTYTDDAISTTFNATKLLTDPDGNDLEIGDKKFTFNLYKGITTSVDTIIDTVTNDKEGKVEFKDVSFAKEGTYKFAIREKIPEDAKYSSGYYVYNNVYYTNKTVYVKAVVELVEGKLQVTSVNYYSSSSMGDSSLLEDVEFINKYEAKGDVTFAGKKTFKNGKKTAFSIECYKTGNDFKINKGDAPVYTARTSVEEATLGDYSFKFNYDLSDVGTYYYVVKELIPSTATDNVENGITYDDKEYYVTVKISDNNDGSLKIEKTVTNNEDDSIKEDTDEFEFINEYKADGSLTVSARKTAVTDDEATYEDTTTDGTEIENEFTTQLYEISGDDEKLLSEVKVKVGQTKTFDKITYSLDDVGEHHYKIVEKAEDEDTKAAGYTYDDKEYDLYVLVKDGGEGKLILSTKENADDEYVKQTDSDLKYDYGFVNTYAANGEAQFSGIKIVENADKSFADLGLTEDSFKFDVSEVTLDEEGNETLEKLFEASTDEDLNIKFESITYAMKDVGLHIYKIEEQKDDQKANILYEAKPVYVLVGVSNNGDGTLSAEISYHYEGSAQEVLDSLLADEKDDEALSEEPANDADTNADAGTDENTNGSGDADGEVTEGETTDDTKGDKAEFVNKVTTTTIEKMDEDGKLLAGATLQVLDDKGEAIYTYESKDEAEMLYGLDREVEYTLHEESAPEGYDLAEDVIFKLDSDGNLLVKEGDEFVAAESVKMTDTKTVIEEETESEEESEEEETDETETKKKNKKNKDNEDSTQEESSEKTDSVSKDDETTSVVVTGDNEPIMLLCILMIISAIMLTVLGEKRKKMNS